MTRIILGDDHSDGADAAWQWLMTQRWPGWSLDVVTATEDIAHTLVYPIDEPLVEWDPPDRREVERKSEFSAIRYLTRAGDPRVVLGNCRDASLLVVGAFGLGSYRATLLGSTADWLLHQPSVPVALVRSSAPTTNVLFCVDGSAHAQSAVEAVAGLPWMATAQAHLLAVDDGRSEPSSALQNASIVLESVGVDPVTTTSPGRPTPVILDTIAEMAPGPDLVVLGTRGLTTLTRLWLGSTAAAVARRCDVNVIVQSRAGQP